MFTSVNQLLQLAFQSALNGAYTILLLVSLGMVVYQWLELRKSQTHWNDAFSTFQRHTHHRLDELVESGSLSFSQLSGHHWEDLVAHLQVYGEAPPPEDATQAMLQSAINQHAMLSEQSLRPQAWERWPGVAVLLGLLGTFVGLTAALTQLPFQGGLSKLTDGLQLVLPLMGTAFWTSVCGLLASLILRSYVAKLQQAQEQRESAYNSLFAQVMVRVRRELYPALSQQGLLLKKYQGHGDLSEFLEAMEDHQRSAQAAQQEHWQEILRRWEASLRPMTVLPQKWEALHSQLGETQAALSQWTQLLEQHSEQIEKSVSALSSSLNPIAHTEELLQERLTGLTRQHEALTTSMERLLDYEKALPERLSEVLKYSLQPAHRMLQRSSQSLHQSIDLVMERSSQERESWRLEMKNVSERFQVLERMTQDTASLTRELTQVSQLLAEIAEQVRFRPRNTPSDTEDSGSESLDSEIDQLLEGLSFRQIREASEDSEN